MTPTPPTLVHLAATRDDREAPGTRSTVPRLGSLLDRPAYLAEVRAAFYRNGERAALRALSALAWDHSRGRARTRAEHREILRWAREAVARDTLLVEEAVASGWLRANPAEEARRAVEREALTRHLLDLADARLDAAEEAGDLLDDLDAEGLA